MHDDAGARTALAPAPAPVLGSDPHDFAGLYIRHRSSFTSHARRYLRDPRDADEVVQEAFLRLFLAMPELESELQALAYCRRTITNLCIDRYRADARRPRLVALDGSPADDLADDDTGDPVVRAEDAALVRQALSQLPELHRAALVMREIEEKPLPVIADELHVAEDSVKHLLYRARRHLRKLLAGTSVAPGVDLELTRGLRPVARGASGGVAGLLLLALLGLGSGPDLRAVPVVGVDLPDVLGVTAVFDAVRDAVAVVVPATRPQEAAAAARDTSSASRSEDLLPPASSTAGRPAGAGGSSSASPPGRAAGAGPAATGRTTTVVTVVDGRPVVTVVPVPGAPGRGTPTSGDLAPAPRDGVPLSPPGSSTGRGTSPYLPVPVTSAPTVVRDVPARTPAGTVAPPGRPAGWEAPGRPARNDDVPPRTGDAAGPSVDRAHAATEKAAERAAAAADRAQDKADRTQDQAERVADKAEQVAARAAEKVVKGPDKAEQSDDRAEQAAAKADRAAERAEAQRAAAQAAAQAAARAAEVAAAQAAAAAAAAAAVPAPVAAVTTTVAPPPAP